MTRMSVQTWILRATISLSLLLFCASRPAHAQIGAGNLQFTIDNFTVMNGFNNGGTANPVTLGTLLTGSVTVNGVTGNGGTTTVNCYANGTQIMTWSTSTSGSHAFPWKPASRGTYALLCTGTWRGVHVNGTVTTPTINVPVT
jgi:hypothetical protein